MKLFLILIFSITYLIGIGVYVSTETAEDFKYYDGGFLGLGYTTNSNRETTPKDVRLGLIWPILFIISVIKMTIWLINDILYFILLIIGYDYRKTKIYNFIDKKFI